VGLCGNLLWSDRDLKELWSTSWEEERVGIFGNMFWSVWELKELWPSYWEDERVENFLETCLEVNLIYFLRGRKSENL
jgi:hypothetical protein